MESKKKNYLKISNEDLERIAKTRQQKEAAKVEVDPEWLAIARFGKHYGWAAIDAVLNGDLDSNTMAVLLEAGDRVDLMNDYMNHQAAFIGNLSANSKKPVKMFDKATAQLIRKSKADING